jgi:CIC family chloride channel protein
MHANDLARNMLEDQHEEINLLAIAGHREDTVTVAEQATLAEVLDMMNQKEVNAACLQNEQQQIVGIVTRGRIESYYTYKPS